MTSPTNSNHFESLGQVPATCSSKRFVQTVRGTSPCDQSLRVNYSGDYSQGLVAGTGCRDWLQGLVAGTGCRDWLQGLVAGTGCRD